jgi:phosphohistidine phosphatase
MIIYFLRHANAGQKKLNPKKDEKRSLDEEGIRQCTQMGRVLSAMQVSVDAVISSPLKRATQTAALVANEIGYDGKLHLDDALRPEATYQQFRDMLRKHAKAEAVMVVGHNPNFSDFLGSTIATNGNRSFVEVKKGAVAKVENEQKKMVLQWMLTPRLARASAEANAADVQAPPVAPAQNGVSLLDKLQIKTEKQNKTKKQKKSGKKSKKNKKAKKKSKKKRSPAR